MSKTTLVIGSEYDFSLNLMNLRVLKGGFLSCFGEEIKYKSREVVSFLSSTVPFVIR